MRRTIKIYKEYEQRTICKFLFFPLQIGNDWRWWEKVKIRQEYIFPIMVDYLYGKGCYWSNLAFVESEKEKVDGTPERIKRMIPPCQPPKQIFTNPSIKSTI